VRLAAKIGLSVFFHPRNVAHFVAKPQS